MTLGTSRLLLRRFTPDDGPGLYGYLSQERAVHYEPYGVQDRRQAARAAFERAGDDAFWAVCLTEGGELIGNLHLAPSEPPQWRTWELGYVFDPGRWGKGFATEACHGLLDRVFTDLSAHRMIGNCNSQKTRSWSLLERLGCHREGHRLATARGTPACRGELRHRLSRRARVA